MSDVNPIREELERPFEQGQIKYRPGGFGQTLAYVETPAVLRRLNSGFNAIWSFEVIEFRILEREVLVHGCLTCFDGKVKKHAFGGSAITVGKESGEPVSIVDDLKGAMSDCIKKAATQVGIALGLYESDDASRDVKPKSNVNGSGTQPETPKEISSPNGTNGNGASGLTRLTAKQLAAIYAVARSKGMTKDDVQRVAVTRYEKMPDFLSKGQASDLIQTLQNAA